MFPTRRITTSGGDVFRDEFSLAFDGTNDFIQLPSTFDSVHDANFSYLFWAKRNATDAIHNILGDTASGSNYIRFSTTGLLSIEANSAGDQADGTLVSNDTNWHHYAVVISGGNGTCQMYQDGVALSMTNPDLDADLKYRRIGGQGSAGTTNSFNGNISEVAIYNKGLSASEVKTLYNGREPYNHKEGVCSSNLQAWYRMGDGALDDRNGLIADQTNATISNHLDDTFTSDTGWSGQKTITGGQLTKDDAGLVDSEDEVDNDNPLAVRKELARKRSMNSTTCILPEEGPNISTNEILNIAPGENQTPTHIFGDKDWEAKAFPHLFPDGKYTNIHIKETKRFRQKNISNQELCLMTRDFQRVQNIFFNVFIGQK